VLLVGTGADEQLAGYGRHRTAFRVRGGEALASELQADVSRLWLRNLGRDDRAIADAAREARHPFLDERVMDAVRRCAPGTLFDLELPIGVGDKRALREIGMALGLGASTRLQKRAIQFGTRLANNKVAGEAQLSDALMIDDLVHRGDGVPRPHLGKDVRKSRKPRRAAEQAAPCEATAAVVVAST
jgi:asparagine synthetase B (glutamine-hydrolysing)